MQRKNIYNSKKLELKRKNLRKNMTDPETVLWSKIRSKQLGYKFRRQYSVGNYILDFYCPERKLALEIDGSQHYRVKGEARDKERDRYLNKFGINVVRFTNFEILKNKDGVLQRILEILEE